VSAPSCGHSAIGGVETGAFSDLMRPLFVIGDPSLFQPWPISGPEAGLERALHIKVDELSAWHTRRWTSLVAVDITCEDEEPDVALWVGAGR